MDVQTATVSFEVTKTDRELILRILQRVKKMGLSDDMHRTDMDLTACHANGNPLRLADLLAAPDFSFIHDIIGIEQHINRRTGQLEHFFSPRYSQPVA